MNLLRAVLVSLWWIWVTLTSILGAEESLLTTKICSYHRLTMFMDCNNVNLGTITPNTYPVNESRIKDLSLQHNGFRRLEYNVFYSTPNLLSLDLSDNLLSSLDYRLFVKTPQMKILNLRNNRLTILEDRRLFEFQKKLISLLLDFNRIKYINESVLNPLQSLQSLFLFGNSLVCDCKLKKTMLWCESKKIQTSAVCESPLKYSNSSWTILNNEECNKTANVTTLKVEILDSHCKYDSIMRSLDCTGVPLRSIRANSFPSNLSFDNLILQNTSISFLESDVFDSLSSLKLLDLSKNFLENLNYQVFSKLDQLTTINLSYNKFLGLPEKLFNAQKRLKVLKLNNNHLAHLAKETLTPLVSLERLDLSQNRFICDCELSEAMFWCEDKQLSTGAICYFPFSGSAWTILQNNTDCTEHTTEIYSTASPMPYHDNFNTILLISVISIAVLFLFSVIGALWYICKCQRKDDNTIYDDICLEERHERNDEVLKGIRENPCYNATINKPNKPSKCDDYEAMNTPNENQYEEIENLRIRNKQCTLQEDSKSTLDLKDGKTEKKNRDVPSYMDMNGMTNRTKVENPYVLK